MQNFPGPRLAGSFSGPGRRKAGRGALGTLPSPRKREICAFEGGCSPFKCLEYLAYKFLYRSVALAGQGARRASKYGFLRPSAARCRRTCRAERHDQVVAPFNGDSGGALICVGHG